MLSLRRVVERASRGVVLRRRMPSSLGGEPLYVSPEGGGLRYWRFDLEKIDPELFAVARRFVGPGSKVWDIGANMGLFSFAASHLAGPAGRVVAVEPDVDNVSLLYRTIRAQRMGAPVDVLCAAVASGSGIARFSIAERGRATNALDGMGGSQMGGVREVRHVPTVTMDQLAVHFGPPTMVKIDVEGAEMLVLRSGQQLLSKHRPTLAMEVTAENASAVTKLLGDCGYRLYDGATMKQVETAQWNTVAVAAEGR